MTIFDFIDRPDDALFFKRDDPNDLRMGEIVRSNPRDYESAAIVLIGLPQDEGVARNGGRPGAGLAPSAVRLALYKLVALPGMGLFDMGDVDTNCTLEHCHQRHSDIVERVLRDGKTVIVIGGGNDTSYPDCSALSRAVDGRLSALNIDAHFDVRIAPMPNSGTPYRQLLEEGYISPEHFYEVGYNPAANSARYGEYLMEKGVMAYSIDDVKERGIHHLLEGILSENHPQAIFWGIDMDVVNEAHAPGVSAPNALGISGHELIQIAGIAGRDPRSRIFEITEVNPLYDIDSRTSRLAANAIWHFIHERCCSEDKRESL